MWAELLGLKRGLFLGRTRLIFPVILPVDLLTRGLRVQGEPGTGKTILGTYLAFQLALKGYPVLLITGGKSDLIDAFLTLALSQRDSGERLLPRLRYIATDHPTHTLGFPFFNHQERGSSYDAVQPVIEMIFRVTPSLEGIAVNLRHYATTSLMALYEAGYQITEAIPFLENKTFRRHVLEKVKDRLPEICAWYRQNYDCWRPEKQNEESFSFKNKLYPFYYSPYLKSFVGQEEPSLDFVQWEKERLIYALDLSGLADYVVLLVGATFLHRLVRYLIHDRSRQVGPVAIVIDEMPVLLSYEGLTRPLHDLRSLGRSRGVGLIILQQPQGDLDGKVAKELWGMATQVVFRIFEYGAAHQAAENLVTPDPRAVRFAAPHDKANPMALPMTEQVHSWANAIQGLKDRWCLVRVGTQKVAMVRTPTASVKSLSLRTIAEIRAASIRKYGRERSQILEEVEKRVREVGEINKSSSQKPLYELA